VKTYGTPIIRFKINHEFEADYAQYQADRKAFKYIIANETENSFSYIRKGKSLATRKRLTEIVEFKRTHMEQE
jgi:hypothetical protein